MLLEGERALKVECCGPKREVDADRITIHGGQERALSLRITMRRMSPGVLSVSITEDAHGSLRSSTAFSPSYCSGRLSFTPA